jgi:MFS family permease
VIGAATLTAMGLVESFVAVLGLVVVWGLLFSATMPIRQAYLNGLIPSRQRATILSFDSLMRSGGGVWAQPVLGRTADVGGYGASYLVGAGIAILAAPVLALSRRQNAPADRVETTEAPPVTQAA